jgi:hypothetical protein
MGFSHYWEYHTIPRSTLRDIAQDFALLVPVLRDAGVPLAGPDGTGSPEVKDTILAFNGCEQCGHVKTEGLGIAWPADDAGDVHTFEDNRGTGTQETADSVRSGAWFAGALLSARTCGGDCSHESFILQADEPPKTCPYPGPYGHLLMKPEDALRFDCTKTAFKPYDLAVQCALIIARHHMRKDAQVFKVKSDGTRRQWGEAVLLCATELGITDFDLDTEPEQKQQVNA